MRAVAVQSSTEKKGLPSVDIAAISRIAVAKPKR